MQSFARCIIFVAVVIGFSLHVCLFVCSCVCFFGQCYLAAKCPICGGLLDRINGDALLCLVKLKLRIALNVKLWRC